MSKKRFIKLLINLGIVVAAIAVFIFAVTFIVAWIAWRSGAPLPV